MSQIPGIKANIDNIIQMALPILDAEGYAICPDCDSRVNCGTSALLTLRSAIVERKSVREAPTMMRSYYYI